jgi:RimJ/RimL family protein N-acetyltransferase
MIPDQAGPMERPRYRITWPSPGESLVALEPRGDELARHAPVLAAAYSHPHNAPLLGHRDPLTARDVIAHYAGLQGAGGHGFLVTDGAGALVGDADLRGVADGDAEFAFLVAAVAAQGRGLGTRIAIMIHAFAFARLGLARVYASIVPHNIASRRVFDKLGYAVDPSPSARRYADDPGDVTLVIDRGTFEHLHAAQLSQIRIAAS